MGAPAARAYCGRERARLSRDVDRSEQRRVLICIHIQDWAHVAQLNGIMAFHLSQKNYRSGLDSYGSDGTNLTCYVTKLDQ